MFKATRWRSEKTKIKIVFKLEFHATKMTKLGWESAMVSVGPADEGKPSKRSEKVTVMDGSCQWKKPMYETVKFVQDPKTGKINDKLYKFTVSAMGTAKGVVIGEVTVNLAEYAEALKSYLISLPLRESTSGPILHASIQKVQTDLQKRREEEDYGGVFDGEVEKITCKLNNNEEEDNVGFSVYKQTTSPTTTKMHVFTGFNKNHIDSNISTITTLDVIKRSEQYFPSDDIRSYSPLSTVSTQNRKSVDAIKDHQRSLSISSGPEVSTDESTNSLTLRFQESDLEMQTIRKRLLKETNQGKLLAQELNKIKEERDALKRKCEEYTGLPQSEEIKQELIHERNLNASLRLQLEKTQESNSELILAVEELEKILEQKNNERFPEMKSRSSDLHEYDCRQEILETVSEEDNEQYMLEELVKGHRDVNVPHSLEMQMEQLALDYEIVKQENHGISSKLEQATLREQLRMQYECLAHSSIISDLRGQIEKQTEAYEVDIQNVVQAKVEQEQRAIKAEEALRILRWKNAQKAENLQREFEMLSTQMSAAFNMNEKLAVKAVEEADELRLQNCNLENLLAASQREILDLRKHKDEKNNLFIDEMRKINLERSALQEHVEKSKKELKDIQISMEKKEITVNTLNSEVNMLREQYKELKNTLFDDEEGKEKLRKQVQNLNSDLQKKENEISSVEKKLRDCNAKMNTKNRNIAGSNTFKEVANLRGRIKLLEAKIKLKGKTIEDMKKFVPIEENEAINKSEELQEKCCCDTTHKKAKGLDGKSHEERINGSSTEPTISTIHLTPQVGQKNKPEMVSQMLEYKERVKTMEAELKEMQERYSEISLKFAEVEGERQQLVMTIRALKNSLKN